MRQNINIYSFIISIILILILLQVSPLTQYDFSEFFGIFIVFVVFFIISKFLLLEINKTTIVKKINTEIENKKELNNLNKHIQNEMNIYNEAKNSYKYFSNEKLIEIYTEYNENNVEDVELLALEEIMVEKGLIAHSKMHEKLYSIKNKLK